MIRLALGLVLALVMALAAPLHAQTLQRSEMKSVPRDLGPSSRETVPYETRLPPGTIVISNAERTLHLVLGNNQALRYKISVGRDGFVWTGSVSIGRKAEWPDWHPPAAMRKRDPSLPDMVPAGPYNPLGARALYLYGKGGDTLYRIHGTNTAETVGGYETSGCFRLSNTDVLDLYRRVRVGARVIVN